MTDLLKCAFRNIFRKKFRNFLTILSIAIGVASVTIISAIGETGKELIGREIDGFGIGGLTVSASQHTQGVPLGESERELVSALSEVRRVSPIIMKYTSSTARGYVASCAVWGMGGEEDSVVSVTPLFGRILSKSDAAAKAAVCMVDENYALSLYGRTNIVGQTIGLKLGETSYDFEVVGVVQSGGSLLQSLLTQYIPSFVYVPDTTLRDYSGDSSYSRLAVELWENTDEDRAGRRIVKRLEQSIGLSGSYTYDNMAAQKGKLDGILSIVTAALSGIAAISLFVAGLGIMTLMLVSVNERTREIGIKKSIGAGRVQIMAEFLFEAAILSGIGSLAGSFFSLIICGIGYYILGIDVIISIKSILLCTAFCVGVGLAFGVYPALQAAKLRPADALRSL